MILVWALFLWFFHFYEWIMPPACPPWPLRIGKNYNIHHRKKKLNGNYVELDLVWVLFLWFSYFSERIIPLARPPVPPLSVKLLISIIEKKDLNENYAEFYFSMGIVLVIFSFFSTVNDLVFAPPPPSGMPPFLRRHNYSHTFAHNSKTTRSIFVKFWEIAKNNMMVTNLK